MHHPLRGNNVMQPAPRGGCGRRLIQVIHEQPGLMHIRQSFQPFPRSRTVTGTRKYPGNCIGAGVNLHFQSLEFHAFTCTDLKYNPK
jgi:hypothetical protein